MSVQTYRLEHGDMKLIAINDGQLFMGPSHIFYGGANPDELKMVLDKYGLSQNGLTLACTCLLVEKDNLRFLVDCGAGKNDRHPQLGQLMEGLAQEGIDAESIDYVILSHGHFDHVNGCMTLGGVPNFPNATYVMSKAEWQYWAIDAPIDSMMPIIRQNLLALREKMLLLEPDCDVVDGVRLLLTAGHTANHCSVEFSSGNDVLICPVDCFDHPSHVEFPQWGAIWDVNPAQSIVSRQGIMQRAAEKNALLHCFHFEFPGFGKLISKENGYLWENRQ